MEIKHLVLASCMVLAGCGGSSDGGGSSVGVGSSDVVGSIITDGMALNTDEIGSITPNESAPFPAFSDDQTVVVMSNAVRDSVIVTESGLQYEVLMQADGAKPSADSIVTVHYAGTLTNGIEFDSSYARGEPETFQLNRTIEGWIEGLQLMSVGSKYRFILPPELAYGDNGRGAVIGPGAALIFIVELLEVNSN